jgi:hypothetical protein
MAKIIPSRKSAMPLSQQSVPPPVLNKLRSICLALPNVKEETAWVGTRWCIHKKNFAHVLMVSDGRPAAYAAAACSHGPLCIVTFRSKLAEFDPAIFRSEPYFKPVWFASIAGMKIDERTDWATVRDHIVASYELLKKK